MSTPVAPSPVPYSEAMSKASHPIPTPAQRSPKLSVAPFEGFDRSASIGVPQELIDDQLASFTEGELKVMLAVVRATNGGQREGIALSVRVLCHGALADVLPGRGTGLSARTVQAACSTLETAGYLRVVRRIAPDGSGLPSQFSLPLLMPGMLSSPEAVSPRFPGYAAARRVRLPLLVIDRLLGELSGAELKVLLYVLRHTFCLGLPDEVMPMARLVENTGLSLRHTRLAVAGLSTRGIVLVQHRQDPERGKLPSRFGVRVLGEAAPFSSVASAAGLAARGARGEESQAEPTRPVWLVPTQVEEPTPAATPAPAAILQVFPQQGTALPQPAAPAAAAQPAANVPSRPSPPAAQSQTPQSVSPPRPPLPPRASTPPAQRTIPATMLRDNHPAWAAVKRILSERLPYHVFDPWIATTASVSLGGPELLVAVQNEHHRWYLESKLNAKVRDALAEAGYPDIRLRYLNYNGNIPSENTEG